MSDIDIHKPGFYSRDALTAEAADFYAEQGFLVVYDAVSSDGVQELCDETVAICRKDRGDMQQGFASPEEEAAFPSDEALREMSADEVVSHFLCIHHAHKISPLIHDYLAQPVIVDVLTRVIGPDVKCMQSMLFVKSAGKPGQAWHQDEDYIPTRDRSLAGAWIAMDDAKVDNGCLWIIPGSHKPGVLWPQYPHNDSRYDCNVMSYDYPYDASDAVPVEVPAGAIVFFNGYLLHKSEPNTRASGFRRSLVNHYMSASSLLPWFGYKGSAAQGDYRDIVMIAGEDPYAWKGTQDMATPGVRAAGEGGCGDGRVDLEAHKANLAAAV